MKNYVKVGKLQVANVLYEFINKEALVGTGLKQNQFWSDLEDLIHDLTPENNALLNKRDELQIKINEWHKQNKDQFDFNAYKSFLQSIGYLEAEVEDFQITTQNVDDEIAHQSGPQLVVPVNNARYALN